MPKGSGDTAPVESASYRELLQRVASNVVRLRSSAGLTQEEAAHRAGLTTRVYVRVEHQETNFTALTLVRIADALGTDIAELVQPLPRPRR